MHIHEFIKALNPKRLCLANVLTLGAGDITYQCSPKKDMAGQFEWVFVGPDAKLNDRSSKQVGKYYDPPAAWESMDGSKPTGAQVAVALSSAGNKQIVR